MTIRWCVLSAMKRRLLAASASTLPGKNSGLSPVSWLRASWNFNGFSLSVFLSLWILMSREMTRSSSS